MPVLLPTAYLARYRGRRHNAGCLRCNETGPLTQEHPRDRAPDHSPARPAARRALMVLGSASSVEASDVPVRQCDEVGPAQGSTLFLETSTGSHPAGAARSRCRRPRLRTSSEKEISLSGTQTGAPWPAGDLLWQSSVSENPRYTASALHQHAETSLGWRVMMGSLDT